MRPLYAALLMLLVGCADPSGAGESSPGGSAQEDAPSVLDITCDGTTTVLASERVQAQSDGVHLLIHNTSSNMLLTEWEGGEHAGDGLDPGDRARTESLLPGEDRFRCLPQNSDPGQEQGGWATFTVLAPPDWVDPTLGCTGMTSQGVIDYMPDATGVDDPLADASDHASKGATVTQAGYVTNQERHFVAGTDGEMTESFVYRSDGQGGWLLSETGGCS
jgi:hypothetical protein